MKWLLKLTPLIAAVFLTAACGDDDDGGGGGDGGEGGSEGGGEGGNGDTPQVCIGTYEGMTEAELAADTSGTCEEDVPVVCSKNVSNITGGCGASCFMATPDDDEAILECTRECVQDQLETDLSEGCLECYVEAVDCARINCAVVCASDPGGMDCVDCRNENGCTTGFFQCSGLPAPGAADGGN